MGLKVGFGPVTAQRGPDDARGWATVYRDALEVAVRAEQAGFDSVWVGEHHFTDDGYLPAVFPMLAAIATRTEHVLLGTKVVLAPLHHPLRIAEDAAAVSILSEGRLALGMAIGYRREEFDAFGADRTRRADLLVECIEVCRSAWSGIPVTHRGPRVDVRDLTVLPTPPPIPIWLGGRAPRALARAGALGDGFVAPAGPTADVVRQLAAVDGAATDAGRPLPPVTTTVNVVLGRPGPAAVERGVDHLLDGYRRLTAADNPTSRIGQGDARSTSILQGGADEVADALVTHARAIGLERDHHLVVRLDYPGMGRADVLDHLERFVTDVLPTLRRQTRRA